MQVSPVKGIDSTELLKVMVDGEGFSTYGHFVVENYKDDTSVAEAVLSNLSNNLLADGFDLRQSKYVAFMVVANKDVWSKIPSSNIDYACSMLNDIANNPGIFKGIYVQESNEDVVHVYSWFFGLGIPTSRLDQLKNETKELQSKVKAKDDVRTSTMHVDSGTNETISAAQKIKDKIAQKSSKFGKFISTSVVDRRK
jgi:hypothetical protein